MLGKLWRHFVNRKNYNGRACLTNTVHDCVWVDCHRSVVRKVGHEVESILNHVRETFNAQWPALNLQVNFGVETKVGRTMATMKPLEELTEEDLCA